jgi:plasmid stabilization system protein ParE
MNGQNAEGEPPLTYVLRVQEHAARDINAAYVRLAELTSPENADEWQDGLRQAIASLATSPRRCPLVPEKFRHETRQLLYRRPGSQVAYRILFTIIGEQAQSPDPPTVIILHIRHASARPITRTQVREIETGE